MFNPGCTCALCIALASLQDVQAATRKVTHLLKGLGPQLSEALGGARVLVEGETDCGLREPGLHHSCSRLWKGWGPLLPQTVIFRRRLHAKMSWIESLSAVARDRRPRRCISSITSMHGSRSGNACIGVFRQDSCDDIAVVWSLSGCSSKVLPQVLSPLPRSPALPACMLREGFPAHCQRAAEGLAKEGRVQSRPPASPARGPADLPQAPCWRCRASETTSRFPDATASASHLHRGTACRAQDSPPPFHHKVATSIVVSGEPHSVWSSTDACAVPRRLVHNAMKAEKVCSFKNCTA